MKHHLDRLAAKGILFDEYGMLKPNVKDAAQIEKKIIHDFISLKHTLDRLRKAGKHILYMPGSYDLIHAGHAFFIEQATELYLALPENSYLTRVDLVVLILADDDGLISRVKASKWKGAGGTEDFKRPIQSHGHSQVAYAGSNWRLFELASIPFVDLVGFIPSPIHIDHVSSTDVIATQKNSTDIKNFFEKFKQTREISSKDKDILEQSIKDYDELLKNLSSNPTDILKSFETKESLWSIQAWQLFLHVYLGYGDFETPFAPFVRIISHNDGAYKDQVSFLMEVSGLKGVYIQDESLISTTDLLAKHGYEKLLEAKIKNYNKI
jgi:hypothetical protein